VMIFSQKGVGFRPFVCITNFLNLPHYTDAPMTSPFGDSVLCGDSLALPLNLSQFHIGLKIALVFADVRYSGRVGVSHPSRDPNTHNSLLTSLSLFSYR
jgi:hypothetical protein